jgi:hypothetical protein
VTVERANSKTGCRESGNDAKRLPPTWLRNDLGKSKRPGIQEEGGVLKNVLVRIDVGEG